MKHNNKFLHVHRQSNHPPALLRNVAKNINKRLTSISSSESIFDEAVAPYQKALDESGYNHKLTYNPQANQTTRSRKTGRETLYGTTWNSSITAVAPLTLALKGLTCSVQACALVDINQPLPWFFTRWPREA